MSKRVAGILYGMMPLSIFPVAIGLFLDSLKLGVVVLVITTLFSLDILLQFTTLLYRLFYELKTRWFTH